MSCAPRRRRRPRPAAPPQGRRPAATTAAARSASRPTPTSTVPSRPSAARPARRSSPSASSTSRRSSRSSSRAALDGETATFPIARNVHDAGILVESVAPAPVERVRRRRCRGDRRCAWRARWTSSARSPPSCSCCATARSLVNELAPRVHNCGHWTIEGAATSQFEQHIRAICGLGLGSTAALSPTAMVNLLGSRSQAAGAARRCRCRPRRPGRPPPSLRQATGLRTPQDGACHGARRHRRRRLWPARRAARGALGWASEPDDEGAIDERRCQGATAPRRRRRRQPLGLPDPGGRGRRPR